MDAFSPTAPARVRTLVLPVGRITRARFYSFLHLLASACEIKHSDVVPDSRPDREKFSPTAFPDGYVLYDFSTAPPIEDELALSPFELFREPLLVLAIADSTEYNQNRDLEVLADSALERIEQDFPRVLVRKVLIFDSGASTGATPSNPDVIIVPPQQGNRASALYDTMSAITSSLLSEMTTLAASLKALPSMASPSVPAFSDATALRRATGSPMISRTNSQSGERPASSNPNHLQRMSMPAFSSTSDLSNSRPASPGSGSPTSPARTFDELVGADNGLSMESQKRTPGNSQDGSGSDRVSISGFGPGSMDERKRNQGKCRVSIVTSSLHILAGRWDVALQELTEAAAQARSFSDHIWHAKALEGLLMCMVLLTWAGASFKIPPIAYPTLERTASKLAQIASPTLSTSNGAPIVDQSVLRKQVAGLIPDLANMILSIYNRAANYTGEYLPQVAYSECVIRLSKIQTAVYIGQGTLNDAALSYFVSGRSDSQSDQFLMGSGRSRITEMLMRAMPGPSGISGLSSASEASILAGMASVLSTLGLHRKKAMLLKEYVQALIRTLDEAKRAGAAEAGLHPSTNGFGQYLTIKTNQHDSSEGLEDFLNLLCRVYGIHESRWSQSVGSSTLHGSSGDYEESSAGHLPDQIVGHFILRSFGSVTLKADILRACIQLCEALPDAHGVLHWVSTLLKTVGPGTAPDADSNDILVTLSREEQLILSSTISKTVIDAKAIGLGNIDAEYWDEFLVRGIILLEAPPGLALHAHKKSDLVATEPKHVAQKGPFIYNPFIENPNANAVQNLLVADEEREFMMSLQNPYDFDVCIESISFMAGDQKFGLAKNLVLRPYRTQSFSVSGAVTVVGAQKLDKCIIKIQGCRERSFQIFAQAWSLGYDPKVKSIGLLKARPREGRPESETSVVSTVPLTTAYPIAATIPLTVIPAQAMLEISSISLPQCSLMLLEGESARFYATIKNTSNSVFADFLHVSFADSTTAVIQEAISKKNLSSAELFELEHQLAHHPAIKLVSEKPSKILPQETCTLTFELLGKPGLTNATVLIDYANLQTPHLENKDLFYTRQVAVEIAVTVNASVQLHRLNVLPTTIDTVTSGLASTTDACNEKCLLLLDLRNAWPEPLEITVEKLEQLTSRSRPLKNGLLRTREVVQPGHTTRMVLMMPKVYIEEPHARIRSANERQFVVSANAISADGERFIREMFWYRESLLKQLSVTWKQEGGSKHGVVDLRSVVRLSPRMVDALKLDDVEIDMAVHSSTTKKDQVQSNCSDINVDNFITLTTNVTNRTDATIHAILRLRPTLAHHVSDVATDLGKRLAWSGLLQTILPPIMPGDTIESNLAICVLCAGEYEVGATVEEVKRAQVAHTNSEDVDAIPDSVMGNTGRRSWVAPTPCRIVVIQ